jgi:cell division protein FtsL
MEKRIEYLVNRLQELEEKRRPYEEIWDKVMEYTHPRRLDYENETITTGGDKIFNGAGIDAQRTHVDGLQGYLVSSHLVWFRQGLVNPDLEDIKGAKVYLEDTEKRLYQRFRVSNFYDTVNEAINDACSVGHAVLSIEDDPENQSLVYTARHPKECYFAENHLGRVDTLFRQVYFQARSILEKYEDKLKPNEKLMYEQNPYERHRLIQAVFPWSEWERVCKQANQKPMKNNENYKYVSIWWIEGTQTIVKESGFETFPFIVWRYRKNSYETYGRGPGMEALYDLIALNQLSKATLKAAQKSVDPPLIVPGSHKGKIKDYPGGRTYVARMSEERPEPLYTMGNANLALEREAHLEQKIKDHYMVDFFFAMQNAQVQMTATEALERQGEKAAIMGAMTGRLSTEFLDPIIQRTFYLENKHGRLPPPPPDLQEAQKKSGLDLMRIEFIGPLASLQKKHLGSQGYMKGINTIAQLANFDPQLLKILDWEYITREMLDNDGLSPKAVLEKDAYRKVLEVAAQNAMQLQGMQMKMAQESHQADMAEAQAKAAKDMAAAQKDANPLAGMMNPGGPLG